MSEKFRKHARILIVDDEPQNVRFLEDVLGWAGYESVKGVTEPRLALSMVRKFDPDLVILDLLMPEMDGFGVIEELRAAFPEDAYLPILVLTSDISRESRRRALAKGAQDFITKPMSPTEVTLRVANLLETRFLYLECKRQERALEDLRSGTRVEWTAGEVERELLERWGASIDLYLGAPEGHARRVSATASRLGSALGLSETDAERIACASLLHDLAAFSGAMSGGNGDGAGPRGPALRLLEKSALPVLRTAREIVACRDERWDGGGRRGLSGESIPLAARIVAVAEMLEGLTESAHAGMPVADAVAEIESQAGRRLDPRVASALAATYARTGT